MTPASTALTAAAGGYLLGSIPWGLLLTRAARGVDVRREGSGNIGATNVARVAGMRVGLLVLALDAGKGAAAVGLAQTLAPASATLPALAGLFAFAGHVAPVWLGFRGGKGVATALGVLTVLVPAAALAGVVVYLATLALTRMSSLGSLLAGPAALAAAGIRPGTRLAVGLTLVLYLGMLWTHRGNIRRLVRRVERRL